MKRFLLLLAFASSSVLTKPALADPAPKHHEEDRDDEKEGKHGHGKNRHDRSFRADDRQKHFQYHGRIQNLPPGLQKKYMRTGTLPPGWQVIYSDREKVPVYAAPQLHHP
ncbi:MAG: hypothetical protein M3Z36_11875 [Acidobacteriota bacterium]|nr:hypothetical protein [Acidobacteriota bacterium]